MINGVYTFYSDVQYEHSTAVLHVMGDVSAKKRMRRAVALWSTGATAAAAPATTNIRIQRSSSSKPALFLASTESALDENSLRSRDEGVVLVSLQPFLANVRHQVIELRSNNNTTSLPSSSSSGVNNSVQQLRRSLVAELEHCPLALRTGEQVAAFFILRCKLYLKPSELGQLMLNTLWQADHATLSALINHVVALHDVIPKAFLPPRVGSSASAHQTLPYSLSSLRSVNDAARDVVSLTVQATGMPAGQSRPLYLIVVSDDPFFAAQGGAPPPPGTMFSSPSSSGSCIPIKHVVDVVLQALRPQDFISVVCAGDVVVAPCQRSHATVVSHDDIVSLPISHSNDVSSEERAWNEIQRVVQQWQEAVDERVDVFRSSNRQQQQQQNSSSSLEEDGSAMSDVGSLSSSSIETLIMRVVTEDYGSKKNNIVGGSAASSPFSLLSCVRRNPVLANSTISTIVLCSVSPPPSPPIPTSQQQEQQHKSPQMYFATVCETLGMIRVVRNEVECQKEVHELMDHHRSLCLRSVTSVFVGGPSVGSAQLQMPSLISSSSTFGVRDLPKANARALLHGRVATSEIVHAVYELPGGGDTGIMNSVVLCLAQRSSFYGGGTDIRVILPSRIAAVEDGGMPVAESWWIATQTLRNALLLPRNPQGAALDTLWAKTIAPVLRLQTPALCDVVTEELKSAKTLRHVEWILMAALCRFFVLQPQRRPPQVSSVNNSNNGALVVSSATNSSVFVERHPSGTTALVAGKMRNGSGLTPPPIDAVVAPSNNNYGLVDTKLLQTSIAVNSTAMMMDSTNLNPSVIALDNNVSSMQSLVGGSAAKTTETMAMVRERREAVQSLIEPSRQQPSAQLVAGPLSRQTSQPQQRQQQQHHQDVSYDSDQYQRMHETRSPMRPPAVVVSASSTRQRVVDYHHSSPSHHEGFPLSPSSSSSSDEEEDESEFDDRVDDDRKSYAPAVRRGRQIAAAASGNQRQAQPIDDRRSGDKTATTSSTAPSSAAAAAVDSRRQHPHHMDVSRVQDVHSSAATTSNHHIHHRSSNPSQRNQKRSDDDDNDDDDNIIVASNVSFPNSGQGHRSHPSNHVGGPPLPPMSALFNDQVKEHVMADPRWLCLSTSTAADGGPSSSSSSWLVPSASSFESAVIRILPSGVVTHKSFSLSLQSLQGGAAYIEFPVLKPIVKHRVTLAARALLLCAVDPQQHFLDIAKVVKLPLEVTGSHAPSEHVFYNLERGRRYCVIHVASTKEPSEWLSYEDMVIADGIEFSTPQYMVEQLRVTDVYARSVALEWDGNAPSYVVTVHRLMDDEAGDDNGAAGLSSSRLPPRSSGGGSGGLRTGFIRRGDDDVNDGHSNGRSTAAAAAASNVATTYHSATPSFTIMGLSPLSLYHVVVAPSLVDAAVDGVFCESCEHIIATAVEPNPLDVEVNAFQAINNAAASKGEDVLDSRSRPEVSVAVSYPPRVVALKDYVLSIDPVIFIDGLHPTEGVVTAPPGRVLQVDIDFDVQIIQRSTGSMLLQKKSLLPLRMDVGPFDMMFHVVVTSVSADAVEIAWNGTGDQFLVELQSEVDDDQCISVGRGLMHVQLGNLQPSTEYTVRVKGKRSINMVATQFRTLPGRPSANAVVVAHSTSRKELFVTLPPVMQQEGCTIHHKAVIHPFEQTIVSETDSETVTLDVAVLQGIHGKQWKTAEGHSFLPVTLDIYQLVAPADHHRGGGAMPPVGGSAAIIGNALESKPTTVVVVTDVRAMWDDHSDVIEIKWFALRELTDTTTTAAAPARDQDNPYRSGGGGGKTPVTFHVSFGKQFLSVVGVNEAQFRLPITAELFQRVVIEGPCVAQEMSCIYFLLPPPPPSPVLFHHVIYEDHIRFEISERINALLDEYFPDEALRNQMDVQVEFISPCFPPVKVPLPVTPPLRVQVPLLLNRSPDAFVDIRFSVAVKDVASTSPARVKADGPVFLNQFVSSRSVALATPCVYPITDLRISELHSTFVVLEWFSNNSSHELLISSGDTFQATASTTRPSARIEDLQPETCYRVQIKGRESGGHFGELFFVTPPVLSNAFVSDIAASMHFEQDGLHLAFDLPETRVLATKVSGGGDGYVKTRTTVTLQHPQNPVEWSSVEGKRSLCTAVLPRTSGLAGERWPYVLVDCASDCVAGENIGPIYSVSSRLQDRQTHRVDLVGNVVLESIDPDRCVVTWMGSSNAYLLTFRTTATALDDVAKITTTSSSAGHDEAALVSMVTQPTTIRKNCARHMFDFSGINTNMIFCTLRGDDGPSNVVNFSIVVPPAPHYARVVRLTPNSATLSLPRPKKSAYLTTGCYVLVGDVKHTHSGTSDNDEVLTVTLDSSKMLIRPSEATHLQDRPSNSNQAGKPKKKSDPISHGAAFDGRPPIYESRSSATDPVVVVVVSHASPRPLVPIPTSSATAATAEAKHVKQQQQPSFGTLPESVSTLLKDFPCLNPQSETTTSQPLMKLHPLGEVHLRTCDAVSAELSWSSTDTEFYVDIIQFLPNVNVGGSTILDDDDGDSYSSPDDRSPPGGGGNRKVALVNNDRYGNTSGGLVPISSGEDGQQQQQMVCRSVVVTVPHLRLRQLQPGSLHMIRIRGRQCGDVVLESSFLTQPLFADRSVILRRHADGNTLTVLIDDPLPEYICGDSAFMFTSTMIELVDGDGSVVETVQVPAGDAGAEFTLSAPLTIVRLVRRLSCEWEGHVVENNNLKTELNAARIALMPKLSNLKLVRVDPNQCFMQWQCSLVDSARFTVIANPIASVNGGQISTNCPKRTAATTRPEVALSSLVPATLYEVTVTEDCSYKIFANRNTRALSVHDDAPETPTLSTFFLTPPKRHVGGTLERYLGGITLHMDPSRVVHEASGLMLYHAARCIPDNTIVVPCMPCRTDNLFIPPPSLPVTAEKPVFVTAVPRSAAPGEPFSAEIAVVEPAGRITHRVEWFQVVELSDRSPFRVNTLNPLQFSDAEQQYIDLVRVIEKPMISHVTSKRATIQWDTSHEDMRSEVMLTNILRPELPPSVHRVVDQEISFEQLIPATAYEVTITPSYQNTACEALNFVMVTAPKRPKAPKISVLLLNAIFDLPATVRIQHAVSAQPQAPVVLTVTHTALVLCTKEVNISECSSATDYLELTQARNIFKSSDTVQRIDLRLRSGKQYVFVFFSSIHHPMAVNGILHSKPTVVEHRTDCYAPTNLHVISRTKTSITVGWSSVDVGSKLLRFVVELAPLHSRVIDADGGGGGGGALTGQANMIGRQPAMSVTMQQFYGASDAPLPSGRSGKFKSLGIRQQFSNNDQGSRPPIDEAQLLTPQQRLEAAFDDPQSGEQDYRRQVVVETSATKPEMHTTFSFLQSGLQYATRVRQLTAEATVDQTAVSSWSGILVAETASPPKPVEKLQVVGVTANVIRLAWVDKQSSEVDPMAYLVTWKCTERTATGTSGQRVQDMRVHTTQCEIGGLSSGLQYHITVTPMNASGEMCMQENASIIVRTESPMNWRY